MAAGKDSSGSIGGVQHELTEQPQEISIEYKNCLEMFEACVTECGDRPAILYFDRTFTYGEIDRSSDSLARWLLDNNVGRGDRVSIILQNMPQFLMMLIAAWKVGAIAVPGNPMYTRRELALIFRDCEPAAILCLGNIAGEVRAGLDLAGVETPLLATAAEAFQTRNDPRVFHRAAPAPAGGEHTLEALVQRPGVAPPPRVDLDGDEIGLIVYTSGTTGQPKGAMIRHRNLAFNGDAMREWCALDRDSRILGIAPFFHITGLSCHIAASLSAQAALVLHYRVEPSLVLDVIREHRPTFTVGAITVFNALMNVPEADSADMASFDRVYSGGAPIPPALVDAIQARLGIKIHSSYGMTETTAQTHLAPYRAAIPVDPASGALSIGKLTRFTRARIVDDNGADLGPGEIGQLLVRGPQIMAGYWRKEKETAVALADGWMHTGDVAFFDENGWYFLVDRIKDVIIASGFKVWPREVEDALYLHKDVREAAVVGMPDHYRGETVKAYVSLKAGAVADPAALIAHCRACLAAYKVPRAIEMLDDLPKTVTGKIQRRALRERAAGA